MAGHWGENDKKNQMTKKDPQYGHDHWKLPYFNGFTASNLCPPPYCRLYSIEITHISCHHFPQRRQGGAVSARLFSTPPPCSPPSPLLSCLPSVIRSVTSPVIHPCVCKLWLSVLKQTGGILLLFPPPSQKKKNNFNGMESWERRVPADFPLGASWRSLSLSVHLRLPHQTSCIHPFIHPFIHPSVDHQWRYSDWNHHSGLLEEAMFMRRAVVLCRRCSGWRRQWGSRRSASDFTVKLKFEADWASGARRLFLFHTHTSVPGMNTDSWRVARRYTCSSVSKPYTKNTARRLAPLWTKNSRLAHSSVQSPLFLQSVDI